MFSLVDLVHEKEDSLTDDIIEDIVDKFHGDSNKHVIMYNPDLFRTKRYLMTELKCHLHEYIHRLNGTNHFFSQLLPRFQNNISDFCIHQNSYHNLELTVVDEKSSFICNRYQEKHNVLQFVWFLHDYDGFVVFGNHKVLPRKGKLVMYPLSWCIPTAEELSKMDSVMTIRGQIFY